VYLEAVMATLVIAPLAGHVCLAAIRPSTRPALPGLPGGCVDGGRAASPHPRWRPDGRDRGEAA
jgi:hypothetical protein